MGWGKNGVLLILLSDLFFGFLPVTVKWANALGYGALQTAFFRFSFALVLLAAWAVVRSGAFKIVNRKAFFWRGFFGGLTVVLYFLTIQSTTAAKATLFNYTYALWANVFDVLIFHRRPPKGFALLLALAAAGVWLVLGIQWSSFQWGDLTGILSGVTGGAAVLSVKEARRTDNALTVFGSFSLFGFLFSAAALGIGFWTPLSRAGEWNSLGPQGWGILCLMGFSAMTAQLLFTQGYGHTSLTMGSLLSLLVPVLAAFWGWMLLGEPLTPHFILGTLFVLTACALLAKKEVVSPLS